MEKTIIANFVKKIHRRQNMQQIIWHCQVINIKLSYCQHLKSKMQFKRTLKNETFLNSPKSTCWRSFLMPPCCFEVLPCEPVRGLDAKIHGKSDGDKMPRQLWNCRIQTQIQRQNWNYNDNIQELSVDRMTDCFPELFLYCWRFCRFESQNFKGYFGSDGYAMPKA